MQPIGYNQDRAHPLPRRKLSLVPASRLITAQRLRELPYPIAVALAFGWMFTVDDFVSDSILSAGFAPTFIEYALPCIAFAAIALSGRAFCRLLPPGAPFTALSLACLTAMVGYTLFPAAVNSVAASWLVLGIVCLYPAVVTIICFYYLSTIELVDCLLLIFIWQLLVAVLRFLIVFFVPSQLIDLLVPLIVLLCFQAIPVQKPPQRRQPDQQAGAPGAQAESSETASRRDEFTPGHFPFLLVLTNALVVFCINALRSFAATDFSDLSAIGTFAAILILAVFLAISDRILRLKKLYVVSLILLELSVLAFSLGSSVGVGASMLTLDAAYVVFSAFYFTTLCSICKRHCLPAVRTFAISYAVEYLAALLAWGTSLGVGAGDNTFPLVVMAVLGSFALTASPTEDVFRRKHADSATERRYLDPSAYYQGLEAICSSISMQFSLSRRENDVLLLLAQQKSAAQIAEVLIISQATAKTHIHNIYKKLDVHSRKELLAFIGQPESDVE